MKPLSEVAPCLLVIQIQIHMVRGHHGYLEQVYSRISYRNGWNTEALIFENFEISGDNQKIISTSLEHLKNV